MTANAIGCEAARARGASLISASLPLARCDPDRAIMAHLGVSVATVEILNPLGLRMIVRYCELWYKKWTKECALTLGVNRRHESELSPCYDGWPDREPFNRLLRAGARDS
jgi:hypothetical protein